VNIEGMRDSDIPFATSLMDAEGWGYLPADFTRLISFDQGSCFVGWEEGQRVGVITSVNYGTYSFLGTLIVRQEYRGRGIGRRLLVHAIEAHRFRGATTMELDGVFAAVGLYRELGFRDKYLSLRFRREPTTLAQQPPVAAQREDYRDIAGYDQRQTGLDRGRVLSRFASEFAPLLRREATGELSAYALVRPRANDCSMIGPFVANNDLAAETMLSMILRQSPRTALTVGVPEVNQHAAGLMRRWGFVYRPPSLRMYWGARLQYENRVYGILSPDKG
jgi:GNAT superfamily N-acetyltransferase